MKTVIAYGVLRSGMFFGFTESSTRSGKKLLTFELKLTGRCHRQETLSSKLESKNQTKEENEANGEQSPEADGSVMT